MFEALGRAIREEVVTILFHAQVDAGDAPALAEPAPASPNGGGNGHLSYEHESAAGADVIAAAGGSSTVFAAGGGSSTTIVNSERDNIGRNDPCWCGSGKKYKKCHGA